MKILISSLRGPTNEARKGGAQEYILKVALGLSNTGNEIMLFCGPERLNGKDLPHKETFSGVQLIRFRSLKKLRSEVSAIYRAYDVTIENVMSFALQLPLIVRDRPFIAIRHHLQGSNFFNLQGKVKGAIGLLSERILEPFVYRKIQWVAASDLTAQHLADRIFKPQKPVEVIAPGFDFMQTSKSKSEYPQFFYVGNLNVARKKVDHLIEAFRLVTSEVPDAKLILAGEGPDRQMLEQKAQGLNVEFVGFIDEEEKHQYYDQSWVFVSPSVSEGFGITWVEANAHGLPMVGYELGLQTVTEGCAIMLPIGDVRGLAQAMKELVNDSGRYQSMSKAALVNAKRFSWEATSEHFLKLMQDV